MGWRKIMWTTLSWLATQLLKLGFEYLDVNKDGNITKSEVLERKKEIKKLLK